MDLIRFLNLRYFFNEVLEIITGTGDSGASFFGRLQALWFFLVPYLKFISTWVSLIFLILAIYVFIRIKQLEKEEDEKYKNQNYYSPPEGRGPQNPKWQRIQDLVSSENVNDWRQAIIEADVILDQLVTKMGYHGATLGEKLKSIEPSDFNTLEAAWEAHKVRNRIAHDGGDFVLTQREARRVVGLFEAVFREFAYI